MIVGYTHRDYARERNILDKVNAAHYTRVRDWFWLAQKLVKKLAPKTGMGRSLLMDTTNQFQDFGLNKVDLVHLFNGVSYGNVPWISTFETILPRFSAIHHSNHRDSGMAYADAAQASLVRKAIKAMASTNCRKLLALSRCNAAMQKSWLTHFPQYYDAVESKLEVLHPPQALAVNSFEEKHVPLTDSISFMFVGAAFHGKGGVEVVETFENLRKVYGYDIRLIIVSSLIIGNPATGGTSADIVRERNLIKKNADWITYCASLPNDEVISLMRGVHIGLLPTYADTYGYSVLEFQSAGCPVISTNVRALDEINNEEVGWIIDVPKYKTGEGIYNTPHDRHVLGRAIRAGLENVVHSVFANRNIIAVKSSGAIANIRDHHDPTRFGERLLGIYADAMEYRENLRI
jgi:glycosyltransferase involved in cell wall biosynthesis